MTRILSFFSIALLLFSGLFTVNAHAQEVPVEPVEIEGVIVVEDGVFRIEGDQAVLFVNPETEQVVAVSPTGQQIALDPELVTFFVAGEETEIGELAEGDEVRVVVAPEGVAEDNVTEDDEIADDGAVDDEVGDEEVEAGIAWWIWVVIIALIIIAIWYAFSRPE